MPWLKGCVLGISNAIAIAIGFLVMASAGLPMQTGGVLVCACDHPHAPDDILFALLVQGIPMGVLVGSLLGAIAGSMIDWRRTSRFVTLVSCASGCMVMFALTWPELVPLALIPTAIHASLLERWTRGAPPLPIARATT